MGDKVRNYHPQLLTADTYEVERFCHFEYSRTPSTLFITDFNEKYTVEVQTNEHLSMKWRLTRGRDAEDKINLPLA